MRLSKATPVKMDTVKGQERALPVSGFPPGLSGCMAANLLATVPDDESLLAQANKYAVTVRSPYCTHLSSKKAYLTLFQSRSERRRQRRR
jgi:hypothetical protein